MLYLIASKSVINVNVILYIEDEKSSCIIRHFVLNVFLREGLIMFPIHMFTPFLFVPVTVTHSTVCLVVLPSLLPFK